MLGRIPSLHEWRVAVLLGSGSNVAPVPAAWFFLSRLVSEFGVTVCLSPTPHGEVKAALDAALAPFDMNRPPEGNPGGQWDWWHLGAGENQFAVKPEYDGDPRLIRERFWPGGAVHDQVPLQCDGGPRALLDFAATRAAAIADARGEWEAEQRDWERLVSLNPPAQPLSAFLARHRADPEGYPRERAIADHHSQPLIRALSRRSPDDPYSYPNLAVWILGPDSDPITYYTRDPQTDFDEAAIWAIPTYALITMEGQWIDADHPGTFGTALPGEDASGAYARHATAYLDSLDSGCVIVRIRCHG